MRDGGRAGGEVTRTEMRSDFSSCAALKQLLTYEEKIDEHQTRWH